MEVALRRQRGFIVVLEDIHDPHNASAIMRTCDALGVQDVWLVFDQVEAWNPRKVGKSSSSSANKWLTFRTFKKTDECIAALQSEGYASIGTVIDGEMEVKDAAFGDMEKVALWVGNEHAGLSAKAANAVARTVRFPMNGFVESLNVSVATALILYEITRQREATGKDWKIDKTSADTLAQAWLER